MSKFPDFEPEEPRSRIVGSVINGAFECNICGAITTAAIWNRQEEKLYWDCPDKHSNAITFRV